VHSICREKKVSDPVKLDINLTTGVVSIECSEAVLDNVFEKIESFLPVLADVRDSLSGDRSGKGPQEQGQQSGAAASDASVPSQTPPAASERVRKPRSPATYQVVDFGLDKEGIRNFKQFYVDKASKSKTDQVITIAYWLAKNAQRNGVDGNDVYSGLKLVDARTNFDIAPALSRLKANGKMKLSDGKYLVTPKGEDYVEHELPRSSGQVESSGEGDEE
jgi:hypothetical protein